jgi:hypothetical protein
VGDARRDTTFDSRRPEGLVDVLLLLAVTATRWVIDELRCAQELVERERAADGRVVRAHHADVMFLEQHLPVHRAFELLEVTHGQVNVPGLERDAPHAGGGHLHCLDRDQRRFRAISSSSFGSSTICPTSLMKMRNVRSEDAGSKPSCCSTIKRTSLSALRIGPAMASARGVGAMPSFVRTNSGSSSTSRRRIELFADRRLGQVQVRCRDRDTAGLEDRVEDALAGSGRDGGSS